MRNTPQQQADLYRKAAETIEMCAKHGIEPIVKIRSTPYGIVKTTFEFSFDAYEWPIAVIESHLVFNGDEIYFKCTGCAVTVGTHNFPLVDHNYSLTPPKRTVMVEMLVEDAEFMVDAYCAITKHTSKTSQVAEACRKALDNLKG